MITIFNRKELCSVFSMNEQVNIRESLSRNNIKYYIRTINNMSRPGSTRGRSGSFGQNIDLSYEYIFYVHKNDYDEARYVINK